MMATRILISLFSVFVFSIISFAQSTFDPDAYAVFLEANQNLSAGDVLNKYPLPNTYYKNLALETAVENISYIDSIQTKYHLTEAENRLISENQFMVSERLSFVSFGQAFHDIYVKDLPVMLTADAILQALHQSYDQILIDVEISILKPNLKEFLDGLYSTLPEIIEKYNQYPDLKKALEDVDLYVTISKSLLAGQVVATQFTSQENVDAMWAAIQSEEYKEMPLFSDRNRHLDFSQFTVRGHYDSEELRDYFKCMMWLGRMDFFLTPPPDNPFEKPWTRDEIRRMNLGAFLLNELVGLSGKRGLLNENEEIIGFMVGENDNLTPDELSGVISGQNISNALQLLDDTVYDSYLETLLSANGAGQKILSSMLMMDPFSTEPGILPISFRLMGQRFIIDSYVFSNLVFDRIVFEGQKIWRPLPDPLDAMFVLGNDDAARLLESELETYHYGSQLASLRYLVDSYDPAFWEESLYNVWLDCIRAVNPPKERDGFPLFMKTAAWQQEKLNTQLASWAQLRHDNLLYAKQSYTGMTGCSFPYTFIEPYPELFKAIEKFAIQAYTNFAPYVSKNPYYLPYLLDYLSNLKTVMRQLAALAEKQIEGTPYSEDETAFLKEMLFEDGQSGRPPYSGWYADLYYYPDDAAFEDYVVADVHTQPTDQAGNMVGKVLHVGTGHVNLGVFLAYAPTQNSEPMAFVGPVASYHSLVTKNFDRLTDRRWSELAGVNQLPERPDWVNIYLADANGNRRNPGRELPGETYTRIEDDPDSKIISPAAFALYPNYPNPFNAVTTFRYFIPEDAFVEFKVYDVSGRLIKNIVSAHQTAGEHTINWDASGITSGVYFCRLQSASFKQSRKIVLVK